MELLADEYVFRTTPEERKHRDIYDDLEIPKNTFADKEIFRKINMEEE